MNKNTTLYLGIGALILIAMTIAPMTDLDGYSFGRSSLNGSPYEGFEGLQREFEKRKGKIEAMSTQDDEDKDKEDGDGGREEDDDSDSQKKTTAKKSSSRGGGGNGDDEENFDLLSSGSFSSYGNKPLDNGMSLVGFAGVYYPAGQEQKLSIGFEGEKECAKKFGLNGGASGVQMTAEQCKLLMSRGGNV